MRQMRSPLATSSSSDRPPSNSEARRCIGASLSTMNSALSLELGREFAAGEFATSRNARNARRSGSVCVMIFTKETYDLRFRLTHADRPSAAIAVAAVQSPESPM